MPTYEYHCAKCKQKFDVFQSIKDAPLTICPKEKCCLKKWGKGKVSRAIGAGAGLIFKGTGFYITDYRSEHYKQAAKKEAGGGAESKPAAKSDPASSTPASTAPKETKKPKPAAE